MTRAKSTHGDAAGALDVADLPADVRDVEAKRVASRRQQIGLEPPVSNEQVIGLALSGGGVRSATFALGVLQSLARARLLECIDYLSTASGGGYIGTFFASLFARGGGGIDAARAAYDVMRGPSSRPEAKPDAPAGWQLWWLRNSGRYLAPTGAGDYVYAVALALRGVAAIHYVVGTTLVMVATMLIALDLGLRNLVDAFVGYPLLALPGLGVAALGIALLLTWVIPVGIAYFAIEVPKASVVGHRFWWLRSTWFIFLFAGLASLCFVVFSGHDIDRLMKIGVGLLGLEFVLGAAYVPGVFLKVSREHTLHGRNADLALAQSQLLAVGVLLTQWLATALKALLMALGAALLLFGTSWLVKVGPENVGAKLLALGGGGGSLLIMAVKQAAGLLMRKNTPRAAAGASTLDRIALALAFVFVLILLVVWFSFTWGALEHLQGFLSDVPPLVVLFGVTLFVGLVTGRSFSFLNLTTIQALYTARLSRAYLGASNPARSDIGAARWNRISDTHPKDNLPLHDYYGTASLAPQHIVNATLNETVSPLAPLVQRDRHGRPFALTPSHYGVDGQWHARDGFARNAPEQMSIGAWIAISGAAFSTGSGRGTTLGKALLLGLSDVRLGYWWNAGALGDREMGRIRRLNRWFTLRFQTQSYLLAELLARYRGACAPYWFLSDGGHFENTAVYELLRRRVGLVFVTDGGADPTYEQDDLANLMRLARIDFGCQFTRIDQKAVAAAAGPAQALADCVWSLETPGRGDGTDRQCISLYWVHRDDDAPEARASGRGGTALIVLKPRLVANAPVDVRQYARACEDFPQQSTSDQFFDEQQWESYRKLGELIGAVLDPGTGTGPAAALAHCFELRRQMLELATATA